jgi:23S rRNA (guanine745-N1)-methyltransferase
MLPEVLTALVCPFCRAPLSQDGRVLRCGAGHTFDVARSGYVSFLVGRSARVGDTPAMIAARARFLDRGHFDPLSDALASFAAGVREGIAVEVGAGTARHLARILEVLPRTAGLALDASPAAARAAARAHPRVASVVVDARKALPIADAAAGVVLVAFAPRNGQELRRILQPSGVLLVASPLPEHLAELRSAFDLIGIDPDKDRRMESALLTWFTRAESREIRWHMALDRADCEALVAMGPSAFHLSPAEIAARGAALSESTGVTGACRVEVWHPR